MPLAPCSAAPSEGEGAGGDLRGPSGPEEEGETEPRKGNVTCPKCKWTPGQCPQGISGRFPGPEWTLRATELGSRGLQNGPSQVGVTDGVTPGQLAEMTRTAFIFVCILPRLWKLTLLSFPFHREGGHGSYLGTSSTHQTQLVDLPGEVGQDHWPPKPPPCSRTAFARGWTGGRILYFLVPGGRGLPGWDVVSSTVIFRPFTPKDILYPFSHLISRRHENERWPSCPQRDSLP